MRNILLHIPHASADVPEEFYSGLVIPKELFRRYNLEMSDTGIDELFRDVPGVRLLAPYSRLYCDVERYRDDSLEEMSEYGEGAVYTHTYDGVEFHVHDETYKNKVLAYYDSYHTRLDETCRKLLSGNRQLLILDCHSFSDKMASHFFRPPFPDVCIGTVEGYSDEKAVSAIISEIERRGHTYAINYPYSGSILPNAVMNGEITGSVSTVMIEVNKRLYL